MTVDLARHRANIPDKRVNCNLLMLGGVSFVGTAIQDTTLPGVSSHLFSLISQLIVGRSLPWVPKLSNSEGSCETPVITCSKEFDLKLIQLYQQHSCLWNVGQNSYKDRNKCMTMLKAIAAGETLRNKHRLDHRKLKYYQ